MRNPDPDHGKGGHLSAPGLAWRFVALIGVVSLLADLTYEGARSITGPFLATLGASGAAVGFVAGAGELVGYALRLVSGVVADRTRRYWAITFAGYAINLIAVPLMALAGRWEIAAGLIVCERLGKAIRSPAKDALLSHATKVVGHGKGFGLHEALDQIGAVTGPLLLVFLLASGGTYRQGFAWLLIPALLALAVLSLAWRLFPRPEAIDPRRVPFPETDHTTAMRWYLLASALIAAGYVDFPLIAFHLEKTGVVAPPTIPGLYALAMGVDAVAALSFGVWFDRKGLVVLVASTLLACLFAPLAFFGGAVGVVLGMIAWGIGMGAQESILRAAIAMMVPPERRGAAFGTFNAAYGVAWFLGSTLMGLLYDVDLRLLVALSIGLQLAAAAVLMTLARSRARGEG